MLPDNALRASVPTSSRKVAIPRLQRPAQAQNSVRDRRRVSRACTECRRHKIKCSGDTPKCQHCEAMGSNCVYVMPRKDKLRDVTERAARMATYLTDLQNRVSGDEAERIKQILATAHDDISDHRQAPLSSSTTYADDSGGYVGSPADDDAMDAMEQLSIEGLDFVDEDLFSDSRVRATGFIGKASEIQWLRSTILQIEQGHDGLVPEPFGSVASERRALTYGPTSSEHVTSFSFYLDNDDIALNFEVDPAKLPQSETAEHLLGCYMDTVHHSFPILPRKLFENQVKKCYNARQAGNEPPLSPKWLAILNLVFAIGAKYSQLVAEQWQAEQTDHLIYHAKAKATGVAESSLFDHPDVPQIQVLGLLAFYYLSIGQISRGWAASGMALRCAYAVGLHVRNEDPLASPLKRETLVHVWWSIYSLERLLGAMNGRPSIIVDSCCSVPLPLSFADEQFLNEAEIVWARQLTPPLISPSASSSTGGIPTPTFTGEAEASSGAYFKAVVQLGTITQNILSLLYSTRTIVHSAGELGDNIRQLENRLDCWAASLPPEFVVGHQIPGNGFFRESTLLAFSLCSARILLTRPCISGLRAREGYPNGPSPFMRRMATMCIDAAKTATGLLPDVPNPVFIYQWGPWWSIVHNIMQAFSVFLLGMLYSVSDETQALLQHVYKLVSWLNAMQNPLARRAYLIALRTLHFVEATILNSDFGLGPESPGLSSQFPSGFSPAIDGNASGLSALYEPLKAGFSQSGSLFRGGPYFHGTS
ncbi:fungal-specific transcription factor domain-containing protein [Massariosphaeria phaeospora]|uniref:Fungal-specific transcription factor domain-containing protein n=1 Tax=Massariosphaeria phaeospora TaxID=100035 RepID=A0A7C8IHL3_9PLEO|nr:fungal-specific transcription factor domain-containing protein [Massariosphaeria phaeospora]